MKLNKREKILIGVLLAVVVSFLLYNFVIKPQRESVETLKSDRSVKLQELSALKEEVASENKLYIELLSLEDDVYRKSEKFFMNVTQEDIILLTEEISNAAKLQIPNIDFPESRVEELILPDPDAEAEAVDGETVDGEEVEEVEQASDEDDEDKPKVELEVLSADLEYEGYYYSFIDFLKEVSDYDKKIIVNDITVSKDEDGYLRGNIALDFYSIENILDGEEELYAWSPNLGYITGDPFSQFGDYVASKDSQGEGSKDEVKEESQTASADTTTSTTSPTSPTADAIKNIMDKFESIGKNKDVETGSSQGQTETVDRGKTVLDFEKKETMFFVGNNKDIKGSIDLNKKDKTQGESSLNLKYDFLEKRKHNMANISFNNNVLIKDQPESLSLSVKPIEKNNASVGVVIRDREGIDYKLKLTDDLNWNGWKTLGVDLPIDINYPAIIERIYVETEDFYDKLTGDMLIDDLRLIYGNEQ